MTVLALLTRSVCAKHREFSFFLGAIYIGTNEERIVFSLGSGPLQGDVHIAFKHVWAGLVNHMEILECERHFVRRKRRIE